MMETSPAATAGLSLDPAFRTDVPQKTFRDAMAALAATACVVTARDGTQRLGRTVTAAMSLGIEPPAILVSIDAAAPLASAIRSAGGFSFAMLSEDQDSVANAFAGKVPAEHRFGHGDWSNWRSGHPRLSGAVATMDCAIIGEIAMANHVLFAGGVLEIALHYDRKPLVWHHRRYNSVLPIAG